MAAVAGAVDVGLEDPVEADRDVGIDRPKSFMGPANEDNARKGPPQGDGSHGMNGQAGPGPAPPAFADEMDLAASFGEAPRRLIEEALGAPRKACTPAGRRRCGVCRPQPRNAGPPRKACGVLLFPLAMVPINPAG